MSPEKEEDIVIRLVDYILQHMFEVEAEGETNIVVVDFHHPSVDNLPVAEIMYLYGKALSYIEYSRKIKFRLDTFEFEEE